MPRKTLVDRLCLVKQSEEKLHYKMKGRHGVKKGHSKTKKKIRMIEKNKWKELRDSLSKEIWHEINSLSGNKIKTKSSIINNAEKVNQPPVTLFIQTKLDLVPSVEDI